MIKRRERVIDKGMEKGRNEDKGKENDENEIKRNKQGNER